MPNPLNDSQLDRDTRERIAHKSGEWLRRMRVLGLERDASEFLYMLWLWLDPVANHESQERWRRAGRRMVESFQPWTRAPLPSRDGVYVLWSDGLPWLAWCEHSVWWDENGDELPADSLDAVQLWFRLPNRPDQDAADDSWNEQQGDLK